MIQRAAPADLAPAVQRARHVGQALAAGPALNGGLRPTCAAGTTRAGWPRSTRIGIIRAADRPWRFLDPDSAFVSRPWEPRVPSASRYHRRS